MGKKKGAAERAPSDDRKLRQRAEAQVEARGVPPSATADERERLLHELRVHQVELEMQNEELRGARLAIEAGLRQYTELFDFAPLGYAVLGPSETIREINHAGARLLGRDRARLVAARFESFLTSPHRVTFSKLLGRARDTEARQNVEVEMEAHGARFPVALWAVAMGGPEPSTLIAFEDVSEQRARQEKLERTESALREADRRKDEFLATLSHELRNPLAPIRTSLFVLAGAEPADEGARRARTIIDRQVTHLARLIDDLLDVTRIARGKVQLQRRRLELGALVRATVDDHRGSLEAARIGLEVEIEPGELWVDGDGDRLVQSVSNVLGNAGKYTPENGRVTITLARVGGEASLRVRDTGTGIAPEMVEHVFEPFAQGPQAPERGHGGLGLGLAMVKGFVELHGGHVSLSSEGPGRGTQVTIRLPLTERPADRPTEPARPSAPRWKRRVLLIDDNADVAESMADALAVFGHELRVAYDGRSALEIARAFLPEVVICDIGLPRMTGHEVAQAFRGEEPLKRAFLVALSGYGRPQDVRRAEEAGFDEYLIKPTDVNELERIISAAARRPAEYRGEDSPEPPG